MKEFIFSKAEKLEPVTLLKSDFFHRYFAIIFLT